jgi:erythromycin esterase-like protein
MNHMVFAFLISAMFLGCALKRTANLETLDNAPAFTAGVYKLSEIDAFGRSVQDASVVGLGESMHMSGGFHELNSKLIKFLITQKGFRSVAFESNWGTVGMLDSYVTHGDVAIDTAMRGLFPQFQSQEVLALVKWIRQYNNENPKEPVRIFGFDTQDPNYNVDFIKDYLNEVAPTIGSQSSSLLDVCIEAVPNSLPGPTTSAQLSSCKNALASLSSYLQNNMARAIAATSKTRFETVIVALTSLDASADNAFYKAQSRATTDDDKASEAEIKARTARDMGMSEVFWRLRRVISGDKKTIIWAHLGHIAINGESITQFPFVSKNMGSDLKEKFGIDYKAFALLAFDLNVPSSWKDEGTPAPRTRESIEGKLNALKSGDLFVTAQSQIFAAGQAYEFAAAKFDDESSGQSVTISMKGKPSVHFDGIFYLERSSAMVSN